MKFLPCVSYCIGRLAHAALVAAPLVAGAQVDAGPYVPSPSVIVDEMLKLGAIRGDISFPMISTHDIGMAAAKALEEGFKGFNTRELHGARNYTHAEATSILGARIGKPDLAYVQFAYDDFKNALLGMGVSASLAGLYVEMSKGFNEGHVVPLEKRSEANTTPTKFEDFAEILAAAYRNS